MLRANVGASGAGTISNSRLKEAFMKKFLYVMMLLGTMLGSGEHCNSEPT